MQKSLVVQKYLQEECKIPHFLKKLITVLIDIPEFPTISLKFFLKAIWIEEDWLEGINLNSIYWIKTFRRIFNCILFCPLSIFNGKHLDWWEVFLSELWVWLLTFGEIFLFWSVSVGLVAGGCVHMHCPRPLCNSAPLTQLKHKPGRSGPWPTTIHFSRQIRNRRVHCTSTTPLPPRSTCLRENWSNVLGCRKSG